jgi:4a-hydroxytetrahydrobiopterin dehydratase
MDTWVLTNNQLTRTFEFNTFEAAMAFMGEAAKVISSMNHHPRWINQYNRIEI